MRSVFRLLAVPTLFGAMAVAGLGCEQLGLSDDDDKRSSDRTRGGDRISSRDTGRGIREIPSRARRLDSVKGREYKRTFDRDGTLYVLDRDDDLLVYHGRVRRDDRLTFDPENDEIRLNNDRVGGDDVNLRAGHEYEFHFLEEDDDRL